MDNSANWRKNAISEMRQKRENAEAQIAAHIIHINALLKGLDALDEAVSSGTYGSHVGASQCTAAIQSARKKCQTALTKLNSVLKVNKRPASSYSISYNSFSAPNGASGETIEVNGGFAAVQRALDQYVELIFAGKKEMLNLYDSARESNVSADMDAAMQKFEQYSIQMNLFCGSLQTYSQILADADKYYHEAQEKAIYRAICIPK